MGLQSKFFIGNLDAERDWGHAKDYVRMMWMILQSETAEDWVIATGKTTKVRDFIKMAFNYIGVEIEFKGKGVNEKGFVKSSKNKDYSLKIGQEVLSVDPKYFRPTEVDILVGDASKAKNKLGWVPKIELNELVDDMRSSDLVLMKKDKLLKEKGYKISNFYE